MTDIGLSPQQIQVIDALSSGVSITDAAAQAGVHRNTVSNWRRNTLPFQHALSHAQYDRALFFRDKAEARVDQACEILDALLADPNTPASVRLKAALYILEKASTPPPPKSQILLDIEKIRMTQAEPVTVDENLNIVPPNPHNSAQSAQQPYRREQPKIGRNEPCPCKSGKKFKHCCLNHPQPAETAAAA